VSVQVQYGSGRREGALSGQNRVDLLAYREPTQIHPSRNLQGDSRHTAPHCTTLQHTWTHCTTWQRTAAPCSALHHTAAHCTTLQHTAAHCSALQHTAAHFEIVKVIHTFPHSFLSIYRTLVYQEMTLYTHTHTHISTLVPFNLSHTRLSHIFVASSSYFRAPQIHSVPVYSVRHNVETVCRHLSLASIRCIQWHRLTFNGHLKHLKHLKTNSSSMYLSIFSHTLLPPSSSSFPQHTHHPHMRIVSHDIHTIRIGGGGRLRHAVTSALIRMVQIARRQIQEEYTYAYVCIRMYTYVYVYPVCIFVCVCMYVCMQWIGVCIYVSMYTHVYLCMMWTCDKMDLWQDLWQDGWVVYIIYIHHNIHDHCSFERLHSLLDRIQGSFEGNKAPW